MAFLYCKKHRLLQAYLTRFKHQSIQFFICLADDDPNYPVRVRANLALNTVIFVQIITSLKFMRKF